MKKKSILLLLVSASLSASFALAEVEEDVCVFLKTVALHSSSSFEAFQVPTDDPDFHFSSYMPPGIASDGCVIMTDGSYDTFSCRWKMESDGEAVGEWSNLTEEAFRCFPEMTDDQKRMSEERTRSLITGFVSGNMVDITIRARSAAESILKDGAQVIIEVELHED